MNIYLIAYTKSNLGDDLFINMLVSKYKNINFDIDILEKEYSKSFENYTNLTVNNKKRDLNKVDIDKYDAIIYIGGSIFMENKNGIQKLEEFNKFIKNAKNKGIPFFYISSNFGPYSTNKYLSLAKDTFSYCEDVCFRDKYSYELFKEIKSVRYAPDLILSYDLPKIEKHKDTVGISVIDLSIRDEYKNLQNQYIEMLKNNIQDYQRNGKTVYLFSFCECEGDENTIKQIEEFIDDKEKIKVIQYNGNIKEFLNIYSSMEYMLCSRFHAMILSAKLKQKVLVLSYSNKIDNVAKDLGFPFEVKKISKDIKNYNFKLEDFKKIEELPEIDKMQFEKLDNFINKKN